MTGQHRHTMASPLHKVPVLLAGHKTFQVGGKEHALGLVVPGCDVPLGIPNKAVNGKLFAVALRWEPELLKHHQLRGLLRDVEAIENRLDRQARDVVAGQVDLRAGCGGGPQPDVPQIEVVLRRNKNVGNRKGKRAPLPLQAC